MRKFTPSEQLENIALARRLWLERATPDNVYLNTWTCGTQACFGGHLASWPEFIALGVEIAVGGAPRASADDPTDEWTWRLDPDEVADRLFGDDSLFKMAGDCHFDDRDGDDTPVEDHYEVVLHRLAEAERHVRQQLATTAAAPST